jgi:hypothetical protein
MKIRIKDNSIRYHLTKSEVKKLCTEGYLQSTTNAGIYSAVRAEHKFYTLLPNIGNIPSGKLVINEIMPSNTALYGNNSIYPLIFIVLLHLVYLQEYIF